MMSEAVGWLYQMTTSIIWNASEFLLLLVSAESSITIWTACSVSLSPLSLLHTPLVQCDHYGLTSPTSKLKYQFQVISPLFNGIKSHMCNEKAQQPIFQLNHVFDWCLCPNISGPDCIFIIFSWLHYGQCGADHHDVGAAHPFYCFKLNFSSRGACLN